MKRFRVSISSRGFTMIELLVVVAIIGVLVAIILVALDQVRKGNKNAVMNQTIISYVNAFELFRTTKGYLPLTNLGHDFSTCVGDGYPNGKCGSDLAYTDEGNTNPKLMAELAPYISHGPINIRMKKFDTGSLTSFIGAVYTCITNVGPPVCLNGSESKIIWYLEGLSQKCALGATPQNFVNPTDQKYGGTRCTYIFKDK